MRPFASVHERPVQQGACTRSGSSESCQAVGVDQSGIEQITPIVAGGAVSAAVGLLALHFGRRIERRDARSAWIREQRLDTYAAMLDTVNGIWNAVAMLSLAANRGDITQANRDDVMANAARMSSLRSRIRLLGPTEVTETCHRLVDALLVFMGQAETGELITEGGLPATDTGRAVRAAEVEFTATASRHLD